MPIKEQDTMAKEVIFEHYSVFGQTDVGLKRTHNEDSILINAQNGLLLIADGMGGHDAGEVASLAATTLINQLFQQYLPKTKSSQITTPTIWHNISAFLNLKSIIQPIDNKHYLQTIEDIIVAANQHIFQLNQERGAPEGTGMGTTIVGCYLTANAQKLVVFHVGDSRLYRFTKQHQLKQITKDHSILQLWRDSGRVGYPPNSNVILQALGPSVSIQPAIQIIDIDLKKDAYFLLCSDGLSDMLKDTNLAKIMTELDNKSLEFVVQKLIDSAKKRGGKDNISAIILQTE